MFQLFFIILYNIYIYNTYLFNTHLLMYLGHTYDQFVRNGILFSEKKI